MNPGHLDRPVTQIRHADQEWLRLNGETEAAFKLRVEKEIDSASGMFASVFVD